MFDPAYLLLIPLGLGLVFWFLSIRKRKKRHPYRSPRGVYGSSDGGDEEIGEGE